MCQTPVPTQIYSSSHKKAPKRLLLTSALALACSAQALADPGTELGVGATTSNDSDTAIGQFAGARGYSSTALGQSAYAQGINSTALGRSTYALGDNSTALGFRAYATGSSSTALGQNAYAGSKFSTALGPEAFATGEFSTALGVAIAEGNYSTALGVSANAGGDGSTALGRNARATGYSSTALGFRALAPEDNTIVLGAIAGQNYATANADVAIGTTAPAAPLHIFRDDDTANLLILESNETGVTQDRAVMDLSNNGGLRFQFNNKALGTSWRFQAATGNQDRFEVTSVGSGAIEMALDAAGNLELRGTLSEGSDRLSKERIVALSSGELLERVETLPVSEWSYKDRPQARHIGPMAQDFYALFGLGDSERRISARDMAGVSLAAIQALAAENDGLETHVAELKAANHELQTNLASLEQANSVASTALAAVLQENAAMRATLKELQQEMTTIATLQEQLAELRIIVKQQSPVFVQLQQSEASTQ